MRLFAALELNDEVRAELASEIEHLRSHCPRIRWVRPENLHLTVRFFGEVDENEVLPLAEALAAAAAGLTPFALEIADLGVFPHPGRPRVVWAGCRAGADDAARLARAVAAEVAALEVPPEKRAYHPHVTLGRVRQPVHARGLPALLEDPQTVRFGAIDVDRLTLFLSKLKRGGARYSPVAHAPLGG